MATKIESTYTTNSTMELCQTRIGEINAGIEKFRTTIEDLNRQGVMDVENITTRMKALQDEKEAIEAMIGYFERKSAQVGRNETRYGETVGYLSALDPRRQETAEERQGALEAIPSHLRNLERTGKILGGLDKPSIAGPLKTTGKSIRELLEIFFGDDGGARAEKDRQYGLIPSETEKLLANFYSLGGAEAIIPFYCSKEYRDLKRDWNETLQNREKILKEDPVLRTFIESEFARITTLPTNEERRTHLEALKRFLWQEKNIPLENNVKQAFGSNKGDYYYSDKEEGYKKIRSNFIKGQYQDALVHDISCRYSLISAQPSDVQSALPSLAVIRCFRKEALAQYGITEQDIVKAAYINEFTGDWNFVREQSGRPNIKRIGDNNEISPELVDAVTQEMKDIARELIPALNARRGKMLAEGRQVINTGGDIVTCDFGLRVKAGEKREESSIESTLPGSDEINLIGATILKNTFETEGKKKETRDQAIDEIKGKLAPLIPEMNAITTRMREIREKRRLLKIKKSSLIKDKASLEEIISNLGTAATTEAKLDQQLRSIGWFKRQTRNGIEEVARIEGLQERIITEIRNIRISITQSVREINQQWNNNLRGTPGWETVDQLQTIILQSTLEIDNIDREENQLTLIYQEKKEELQALFTQLKALGVTLAPSDYRVTPLS